MTKRFGGVTALDALTLEIRDGEFFVLLGPSGCGKTTALRIVAGLDEPSSGSVYIGERLVNELPPKDRDLAMVFQNYALYPHMTVYDNVAFGLRMRKLPRGEIDRLVRSAAGALGIDGLLDRRPGEISGGQRQRVALGRAIVRQPQAFLMDEPLSNLDAKMRVQMRAELVRIHRDVRGTFIYVTHDQIEAMTMGERMAVLDGGRLQQVGNPQEVYDRPANLFVAQFIGSPAMNLFDAKPVVEGGKRGVRALEAFIPLPDALWDAAVSVSATKVTAGVRPEHLAPVTAPEEPAVFTGKIDLVESLGNEQHVSIALPGTTLTVRVPAHPRFLAGETLRLSLSPDHLHLFDGASGERISS